MTRWKITGIIATLVIIFSIPLYVVKEKSRRMATQTDRQAPAEFVGSDACRDCHQSEYDKWKGSHHQLAMAVASETSRTCPAVKEDTVSVRPEAYAIS